MIRNLISEEATVLTADDCRRPPLTHLMVSISRTLFWVDLMSFERRVGIRAAGGQAVTSWVTTSDQWSPFSINDKVVLSRNTN